MLLVLFSRVEQTGTSMFVGPPSKLPASNAGYGSIGRGVSRATNITLDNETQTKVILFPGATGNSVTSRSTVTDEGKSDNNIIQQ